MLTLTLPNREGTSTSVTQNPTSRPVLQAAANLSAAVRRCESAEKITDMRRKLRAAQLEKHVKDLVEQWPPLTDDQLERVAALLGATRSTDAGAA